MQEFFSKINKNIWAKILIAFFGLFFFVFLILAVVVKFFVSYNYIENRIFEKTGLKVEFVKPNSSFDYKFNLNSNIERLNIYNSNNNIKLANIDNLQISLKPLGLLFGRIYLKNVSADNIEIDLKRDSNGKFNFPEVINFDFLNEFKNKKIVLTRLKTDIKNLDFTFEDDCKIKNKTKVNFDDFKIDISKRKKYFNVVKKGTIETYISNNKQIADFYLIINSKYPFGNIKSNDLKIDAQINNLDLFIFSDIARKYISKDIISTSGSAKFKIATENNNENYLQVLQVWLDNPSLKLSDDKIISPYKNGIRATIPFNLQKDELIINESKIVADELLTSFKGSITKIFSTKPKFNLDIDFKDVQLNKLFYFIPDNAIFYQEKGIPTLKKSNFHGVLNGKMTLNLFPLNAIGNLKISNVHIPKYPKTYRQNDVNLMFMGDKVRVYTRVYTPDNEYVVVDGVSNLDNSLYGKYTVKSTSKIDLSFAKLYLVPIQQIVGFNIGPVPIMDISGYGKINIDTQGTIFDARIFGEFEAYNATAKLDGLAAKLTNGTCKLVFDDKKLIFKEIKGKLEGGDFLLTGIGDTKGNVKLNAKINNLDSTKALNIFNNSVISKSYNKLIKRIESLAGIFNADIDLVGVIQNYEDKEFLQSLLMSGKIKLKDNKVSLNNGISVDKLNGLLSFGEKQNGAFDFYLGGSKFDFKFNSKDNLNKVLSGQNFDISTEIFSNKIAFLDVINKVEQFKFKNELLDKIVAEFDDVNFYSKLYLKSSGMFSFDNPQLAGFIHNGYWIGLNNSQIQDVKFNSGIINFQGDKVNFNNLDMDYKLGNIKAKGYLYNISSMKPVGDLNISFKDIQLQKPDKLIPKIKTMNGILKSGTIIFKGDDLKLSSFNINYDSMPLFINAKVKDLYGSRIIDTDFSAILDEKSSDNVINPYLISPIKIAGELPIKGSFKGSKNNYAIDFSAIIPKGSDVYFSGSNLGDINQKRELQGKITVVNKIAAVNNLKLIKYITNQNNKINPLVALRASGQIIQKGDELLYDDFKVTTFNPINVRILNLIFKKSLLKKGNFDCNIVLNGNLKLPQAVGRMNFYDLDIPLYNTQIKNVKFAISNKFIDGEILAQNRISDVKINFHALNKLNSPYIIKDFKVLSNKLDVVDILSSIKPSSNRTDIEVKENILLKPNDIIVEKGSFDFKDVQFDKIKSKNLKGEMKYKDGNIDLSNISLDIADGSIYGSGKYNIKTTQFDVNALMDDCNSEVLAYDFLNLSNQIYGKMDGSVKLRGKKLNTPQGIKNIKSEIAFSINNGKMPKLGSLEYLLRAGNLIKNGIMGLSLNNIIEVLTPYKTGDFEKITGNLIINNAEIETLNIKSQGKNLSLYLEGNYSILENFADIKIYGKLTQNISNALGALGNASISQFVNVLTQAKRNKNEKDVELQNALDKIPSIEIENPEPRYFKAKVLGDINKENYIKNFDWI